MNDLTIPEDLGFKEPEKALYATCPLWNPKNNDLPFEITEDFAFVLGTEAYRPIPVGNFVYAIRALNKMGALQIRPSDLKERIDENSLEDVMDNLGMTYLLCDDVYMRFRKDGGRDIEKKIHTFTMLGEEEKIIRLADKIKLPHPFNDSLYPYKKLFKDARKYPLPVLKS